MNVPELIAAQPHVSPDFRRALETIGLMAQARARFGIATIRAAAVREGYTGDGTQPVADSWAVEGACRKLHEIS